MDGQIFIINQNYMLSWQQQQKKGENYLVDTTDTYDNSYIVEHLKDTKNCIMNCEKEFTSTVRSLVTDNTFSVKGMHTQL